MKTHPDWLKSMALRLPAGEAGRFFYGDNLEGYFEGFTGQTARGSGYWLDGRPVFRDLAARFGSTVRTREEARRAEILPHAVRHVHRGGGVDELSILHRRRAVAVHVQAPKPVRLGADLIFDSGVGDIRLEPRGSEWLVSFAGCPLKAGISATSGLGPVRLSMRDQAPVVSVSSRRAVGGITLYLAFDRSAARALARCRELRDTNARAAHAEEIAGRLGRSRIRTDDPDYDRAVAWAKLTSYFLVTEEFGKGIWAGLPWFKNNWGRDTFIALPGTLLVSGLFDEAREVIRGFLRYQDTDPASPTYGRVPNRVSSATDIIYNTADGTPWLIRELYEYLQYTGDVALARETYPQVRLALEGAIQKAVDAEGFLTHDDADTWMDARIEGNLPWSPRGNRANDIQALWHHALLAGERLAGLAGDPESARRWRGLADGLRARFVRRFWNARTRRLADRIEADNRRDEKVRPNQLMVISIPMIEPLLDEARAARVVENAVGELLFPYGIASLSPRDPWFHPFHHNDEWHHFDAAYHNGTVWGWNAGFTVTALCRVRQTELAARLARNLTRQILDLGCRGSMSELIEAMPRRRGKRLLSGTWAQAWSTSEFARNAHQDFGGFHPRLLDGALCLEPHLPRRWSRLEARYPFGDGAALLVNFRREKGRSSFRIRQEGHPGPLDLRFAVELNNRRFSFTVPLESGRPLVFVVEKGRGRLGKRTDIPGERLPGVKALRFVRPVMDRKPPCLREKNYLQKRIESRVH